MSIALYQFAADGRPVNRIWQKHTGDEGACGLRDPAGHERRTLFECRAGKVSTFGKP